MKARRIAAVAVGAMLVLGLTACVSSRTAAVGASQDGPGGQLVGVTMPTKQSERWVQDGNNVKAQLEAAGYTVDLQYAENGLMAFNNLAGEPITGLAAGRPLFLRSPGSTFDLATFMRTQLYAALATLRIGMDVLTKDENVGLDAMFAHGGLFTTKGVAQRFLAAAIDTPVAVGSTASEGGPWGMAVLAAFLTRRAPGQGLADYLSSRVFAGAELDEVKPDPTDVAGFDSFMQRYIQALPVQRAAVEHS